MTVLVAFIWKCLLTLPWLLHVLSGPKIGLKNINKKIHFFRKSASSDPFCLRARSPFVFNSLARVILLTERRILRVGSEWRSLRNELNSTRSLGYGVKIYKDYEAVSLLDQLFILHQKRNFRVESGFSGDLEGIGLIVCAGSNSKGEVVAVSAAWVSATYAINFYYFSTENYQIRWLVNEELIQAAYKRGVKVFQTDNLMDTSTGSYIYQKQCGYQTVRLKFH